MAKNTKPPKGTQPGTDHPALKGVLPTAEELEAQRLADVEAAALAKRKHRNDFVETTDDQHYPGEGKDKGEIPEDPKRQRPPRFSEAGPDHYPAAIPSNVTPFGEGEGILGKIDHTAARALEDVFDTLEETVTKTPHPNKHPAPKGFADADKDGRSDLVQSHKAGDPVAPHDALPKKPGGPRIG